MVTGIVCDIEGTTSSISFVKDILFPYAAERLPAFIRQRQHDTTVNVHLDETAQQTGIQRNDIAALTKQLLSWIEDDVKATPLKALQGQIWAEGYQTGAYQAHIYPDAYHRLKAWHAEGIKLFVYSSGSIQAQTLFFQYSCFGDMRPLFTDYFDTTTGAKNAPASYHSIAQQTGMAASDLLFLSDIESELDAAKQAKFNTIWVIRPEDSPVNPATIQSIHPLANTFSTINLKDIRCSS